MKRLQVQANVRYIDVLETFIATAQEIPQHKRTAALIIATEVFENIAEHARFVGETNVRISLSNMFVLRLCFSYKSVNFADLLNALKKTRPHFDPHARRYRGFGLLITKTLARKVFYRHYLSHCYITIYV